MCDWVAWKHLRLLSYSDLNVTPKWSSTKSANFLTTREGLFSSLLWREISHIWFEKQTRSCFYNMHSPTPQSFWYVWKNVSSSKHTTCGKSWFLKVNSSQMRAAFSNANNYTNTYMPKSVSSRSNAENWCANLLPLCSRDQLKLKLPGRTVTQLSEWDVEKLTGHWVS